MGRIALIATCVLNQWALDFHGNKQRILESVRIARSRGAKYRVGPELEIPGYSCNDHFYESDTFLHSWEVLRDLLQSPDCVDIVCDVGMPVMHRGRAYNCRVLFYNGRILLIRPKISLALTGNYREGRWFSPWPRQAYVEDFHLPRMLAEVTQQETVPFGDALLSTLDTVVTIETCQELWSTENTHTNAILDGAEIIVNSSASHHELRKLNSRVDLVTSISKRAGCAYVYTNARGCDGERVYFDGGAMVAVNGALICQSEQFSLLDVEVNVAGVDLEEIRAYRLRSFGGECAHRLNGETLVAYPRVRVNVSLSLRDNELGSVDWSVVARRPLTAPRTYSLEEEISVAPGLWLWDYLRRSNQAGFFLPLSGGLDSSSVACIVFSLCERLVRAVLEERNAQVLADIRRVLRQTDYQITSARDLCGRLLTTCYMGTENSSVETRTRAEKLSAAVGAHHLSANIDCIVQAMLTVFMTCLQLTTLPRYRCQGGSLAENQALQNIQARIRMVLAYFLAQLSLWARGGPAAGSLLVLSAANLDEALRGYMTKYDCSSGDLNPIGGLSKEDLRRFVAYFACRRRTVGENNSQFLVNLGRALTDIVEAPATAELEPLNSAGGLVQTDEVDMGLTYAELSILGTQRKVFSCGPYSMFAKLWPDWIQLGLSLDEVAHRVKHFFRCYAINRHKLTVLTPSYHLESYGVDDNRYDLRPFLYPCDWQWQFAAIDTLLKTLKSSGISSGGGSGKPRKSSGQDGGGAASRGKSPAGAAGLQDSSPSSPRMHPPPPTSAGGSGGTPTMQQNQTKIEHSGGKVAYASVAGSRRTPPVGSPPPQTPLSSSSGHHSNYATVVPNVSSSSSPSHLHHQAPSSAHHASGMTSPLLSPRAAKHPTGLTHHQQQQQQQYPVLVSGQSMGQLQQQSAHHSAAPFISYANAAGHAASDGQLRQHSLVENDSIPMGGQGSRPVSSSRQRLHQMVNLVAKQQQISILSMPAGANSTAVNWTPTTPASVAAAGTRRPEAALGTKENESEALDLLHPPNTPSSNLRCLTPRNNDAMAGGESFEVEKRRRSKHKMESGEGNHRGDSSAPGSNGGGANSHHKRSSLLRRIAQKA